MNISSVVVKTAPEHLDTVLETLRGSDLCEVHFHDDSGKIIVTLEGSSIGEEMVKMKEIMNLPHVLSATLAYSYSEGDTTGSSGGPT
ncbi:MAG: chaperone NapD [Chloroflexota bacterium]|jgi:periplasmic nitrate reductase NapD